MAPPPLPPLVVITDTTLARGRPVADIVAAAIEGGCRAVLIRDKSLAPPERHDLAKAVTGLVHAVGGAVAVSSDATLAEEVGADGLHLAAADPPARTDLHVGRSCHSDLEMAGAAAEGCAYAFLSPIFLTPSKPGYGPAIGPGALSSAPLPVWALGGVAQPAQATACRAAGAAGIAVMGAVMGADDPAATVSALLDGWGDPGPAGPRRAMPDPEGPQRRE